MEQLNVLQVLLLVVLLLAAAAVLLLRYNSSTLRGKLPPGPRPLPVLGNLLFFASSKCRHRDLYKLAETYGPLMWLRLGTHKTVVVQSPALAMEVLKQQDSVFASRPPAPYSLNLVSDGGKGPATAPYGPSWRFMRKVMTTQLLTQRRISDFQHVRAEEVARMTDAIRNRVGQPVDLRFLLHAVNLNNITRMGFGKAALSSYDVVDRHGTGSTASAGTGVVSVEDHELVDLVSAIVEVTGMQGIGDAIPWLSFLDTWFILPKAWMKRVKRQLDTFFHRILQEHREYLAQHPGSPPRDFVDVLLVASASDTDGHLLTDDMVVPQLVDMVGGGTDTSSSTTEWAMAELLRHPALLQRAVDELEQVVGKARAVAESDIPRLPYLKAVVQETLRLHPALPLLIPHYSLHDTTVAGYHIPAGTIVLVNAWALGQDPACWDNPQQFRPDRFFHSDGDGKGTAKPEVDLRGHHFQLLPFGSGKRMCPGIGLGLAMAQLTLATLLHSFTWSLPANEQPESLDMTEKEGIIVRKAVGLMAVPHAKF